MASSWHLMLTTVLTCTLHFLRVYWRVDTLSPRLPVPGRAWWHLPVRIGAPAHTLHEPSLQTITMGQLSAQLWRGCVPWEPYQAIALPRQRVRGDRSAGRAHGRGYACPTCCGPHCNISWAISQWRPQHTNYSFAECAAGPSGLH